MSSWTAAPIFETSIPALAVAIAASMKADLCQIYTDVDGVYTADPRFVKNAFKLDDISYDEIEFFLWKFKTSKNDMFKYLTENDLENLKQGVVFNSKKDLTSFLEDFTS